MGHLCLCDLAGFVFKTSYKHGKLDPKAKKHIFIRYSESSKDYVIMYGEHPNGGMIEVESCDKDFIETDFFRISDTNGSLDLYEENAVEIFCHLQARGGN